LILREADIVAAEEMVDRKGNEALARVAGMIYLTGGRSGIVFDPIYKPELFGDVMYSNLRFRGMGAKTKAELAGLRLQVAEAERQRGRLWYLVGVSPARDLGGSKGRMVAAAILGWYLDTGPGAGSGRGKLSITPEQLAPPAPMFWCGKTDDGKIVDWHKAVVDERQRHAKGRAEDADKRRAGQSGSSPGANS
jgi:hypothetical protein